MPRRRASSAPTPTPTPAKQAEVLTFEDWFHGRFWTEWVIAQKNKPSEVEAKQSIYKVHLGPAFGRMPLGAIDFPVIARFRAKLIESGLSDKRINNILAVLSKALNCVAQARVIASAPSVGMLKVERPEIVAWSLEEYARLLAAAKARDARPAQTRRARHAALRVRGPAAAWRGRRRGPGARADRVAANVRRARRASDCARRMRRPARTASRAKCAGSGTFA